MLAARIGPLTRDGRIVAVPKTGPIQRYGPYRQKPELTPHESLLG